LIISQKSIAGIGRERYNIDEGNFGKRRH